MNGTAAAPPPGDQTLWNEAVDPRFERRILVLAPTGNDARLTAEFLEAAGLAAVCVSDAEDLSRRIVEGCGAIVLAEEGMNRAAALQIFPLLRRQPAWSDVPVTLITTAGVAGAERLRRLGALGFQSTAAVLERPFRPATLVSTLQVALRSRDRQYEVRKLLAELGHARDTAEGASHAKDEFLAALSHELRTPLNPALLLATENAEDRALPEAVREDFAEIARNITLEARLIDDLLDLTRITQGKLRLGLTSVDAHAAIRAALETTRLEMSEKRLIVELALAGCSARVRADPVRMQQVLWNILKNAAKFTPEGGRIRIETEQKGARLVIRIADSGAGMDAEDLSRIFSAFVQGKHAKADSRHRFGGLGLGLAISRRLMELHGGSIVAASDGPGRGSTFTVEFPFAEPGGRPDLPVRGAAGSPSATEGSRRLLLVEDHLATRQSLQRLLERRGYQVKAVGSLAEARAALAGHAFELILSDLGLPDGNGQELMAEVSGGGPIKGIALSGYGMEADLAQSREAGFSAHLTKPVTIQALDAALAEVVVRS